MPRTRRDTAPTLESKNDWFNASIMQPIVASHGSQGAGIVSNESISARVGKQFSQIAQDALQAVEIASSRNQMATSHRFSSLGGIPQTYSKKHLTRQPSNTDHVRIQSTESSIKTPFTKPRNLQSSSTQVSFDRESPTKKYLNESRSKRRSTSSFRTTSTSSKHSGPLSRQHTDSSGSGRLAFLDSPGMLKAAPSCPGILVPVQATKYSVTTASKTAEYQSGSSKLHERQPQIRGSNSSNQVKLTAAPCGLDFYRIQETIGTGNFSQVKLATHILTKELVAIKVLDKTRMNPSTQRLLMREISILECLHHPNVVRLYEVVETLTRLHLVMEYVAGGDLNKRIGKYGKFTEPEAKIIFAQLVSAVNHLHERNIFHRDIKADNILFTTRISGTVIDSHTTGQHVARTRKAKPPIRRWLRGRSRDVHINPRSLSETSRIPVPSVPLEGASRTTEQTKMHGRKKRSPWGSKARLTDKADEERGHPVTEKALNPDDYRVKLADFGFSRLVLTPDQPLTTFCGSPAYAAPELFEAQSYRGGPVDIWALGIVLFFLLTGLLPYRGSTVGQVRRLVLENRGLQPPGWLSSAASALYSRLTARTPDQRPTVAELIEFAEQKGAIASEDDQLGMATNSEPKEMLWTTWLSGQSFPKPLPRFNRCAPYERKHI